MGRKQGSKKTGGRKKGTPNKKTQDLVEILDSLNFNIPCRIHELLPLLEPDKQADVLIKLMEFVYPKRRAIEAKNQNVSIHTSLAHALSEYSGEGDLIIKDID